MFEFKIRRNLWNWNVNCFDLQHSFSLHRICIWLSRRLDLENVPRIGPAFVLAKRLAAHSEKRVDPDVRGISRRTGGCHLCRVTAVASWTVVLEYQSMHCATPINCKCQHLHVKWFAFRILMTHLRCCGRVRGRESQTYKWSPKKTVF